MSPLPTYEPALRSSSAKPILHPERFDWRGGLLIRSTNWLGDVLMTLPAIYQLIAILPPGTRVGVLTARKLTALWESVPWVDQVIPFSGKRLDSDERQAATHFDPGLTVVLPNSFGSAFDLWRAGIPNRLGRGGRGRAMLLDFILPPWQRRAGSDRHHQVCEYLDIVAACRAPTESIVCPPLQPALSTEERQALDGWLRDDRPLLTIAPGAAYGPAKQWPAESYAKVANWWCQEQGGRVIAIGAPGEEDSAEAALEGCPAGLNLAGKTSLTQLMALLQAARCVIANDSGSMHLGAALGCRGVAIFGSTDPVATGPLGGQWIVLRESLPCSPCLARTCSRTDAPYECLKLVTPEQVIQATSQLTAQDP